MGQTVRSLCYDEDGASMTEYAFLAALIAIVVMVGANLLGNAVNTRMVSVGNSLNNANPP